MKELHVYGSAEQIKALIEEGDSIHFHITVPDEITMPDEGEAPSDAVEDFTAQAIKRMQEIAIEQMEETVRAQIGKATARAFEDAKEPEAICQDQTEEAQTPAKNLKKKICIVCGNEFYAKGQAKMCSKKCKNKRAQEQKKRSRLMDSPARHGEEIAPPPKPSGAFEIEKLARAEGKRYADIQRADTLEKYGRVKK